MSTSSSNLQEKLADKEPILEASSRNTPNALKRNRVATTTVSTTTVSTTPTNAPSSLPLRQSRPNLNESKELKLSPSKRARTSTTISSATALSSLEGASGPHFFSNPTRDSDVEAAGAYARANAGVATMELANRAVPQGIIKKEPLSLASATSSSVSVGRSSNALSTENDLHKVIRMGDIGRLKVLLASKGVNLEQTDKKGRTPLHVAAKYNHKECLEALLKAGADVHAKSWWREKAFFSSVAVQSGKTALHFATLGGHQCVQILLNHGANVDERDEKGQTALHLAALGNHTECLKILLDAGAKVNEQNQEGKTALHIAAKYAHNASLKILLRGGRDAGVNKEDSLGYTALHYAVHHPRCLETLLAAGADVNAKDKTGCTVLHRSNWHLSSLIAIINAGADVNARNNQGRTALHGNGLDLECLITLIAAKADVNAKDNDGCTALHFAAWDEKKGYVTALLKAGANIQMQDSKGLTALHLAARHGAKEPLKALLEAKANPHAKDNEGQTALHYAAQSSTECLQFLLSKGANVNEKTNSGDIALHFAVRSNRIGCVKLLVENGANVQALGEDGCTPFSLAQKKGHKRCIAYFETLFAEANKVSNVPTSASSRNTPNALKRNRGATTTVSTTPTDAHSSLPLRQNRPNLTEDKDPALSPSKRARTSTTTSLATVPNSLAGASGPHFFSAPTRDSDVEVTQACDLANARVAIMELANIAVPGDIIKKEPSSPRLGARSPN